jgi:hypothetical protein
MTAGATYVPIATQTLGSAAPSVTFNSIPQGYTDLIVVIAAKNNTAASDLLMQFNGDTTATYSYTSVSGNGTSATSTRGLSTPTSILCNVTGTIPSATSTFAVYEINIQNYSNATTYKTALIRANSAGTGTDAVVGLWRATPQAITSILIKPSANSFDIGSTFTLYGIAAA